MDEPASGINARVARLIARHANVRFRAALMFARGRYPSVELSEDPVGPEASEPSKFMRQPTRRAGGAARCKADADCG